MPTTALKRTAVVRHPGTGRAPRLHPRGARLRDLWTWPAESCRRRGSGTAWPRASATPGGRGGVARRRAGPPGPSQLLSSCCQSPRERAFAAEAGGAQVSEPEAEVGSRRAGSNRRPADTELVPGRFRHGPPTSAPDRPRCYTAAVKSLSGPSPPEACSMRRREIEAANRSSHRHGGVSCSATTRSQPDPTGVHVR